MKTHKICKGTGKAKGYGCGLSVDVRKRKYGLGTECCYAEWLYTSEEGKQMIERATLKSTAPRRELEAFEKQEKERKGLPALLKNTVNAVHNYIKERDKYKPCISCGTPWNSNFHAGHYYKAELYSSLKFDFLNINGQCVQCNIREEGNLNGYTLNLSDRIGFDNFNLLNAMAREDKYIITKWDRDILKHIRQEANIKLKKLQAGEL